MTEEQPREVRHRVGKVCPLARAECMGRDCAWAKRQTPPSGPQNVIRAWECGAAMSPRQIVDFDAIEWRYVYVPKVEAPEVEAEPGGEFPDVVAHARERRRNGAA